MQSGITGSGIDSGPDIAPAELAATGVPVLFIAGSEDVLFPVAAIRAMHTQLDGSSLIEIGGAGHSAFRERPEELDAAVAGALEYTLNGIYQR